jgi:hypothetical protein
MVEYYHIYSIYLRDPAPHFSSHHPNRNMTLPLIKGRFARSRTP